MAPPSPARNLITPLEPDRPPRRFTATSAAGATHAVYASPSRRLEAAVASSCGMQHGVNEDAHSPLEGNGCLFVVADGVGGGAMAQLASRLLVEQLHEALDAQAVDVRRVDEAILGADRVIAAAIARVTDRPGAATVVLCSALDAAATQWLIAWVGDCRACRWSPRMPERLEHLTRDDTFGRLGETPPRGGSLDDPARMVGNGATSGANTAVHALARGDVLALCSDGVHKHLDDADWCRLLASPQPLARRADQLVALARAQGSVDDATVLLLTQTQANWRGRERRAGNAPRREGDRRAP